MNRIILMIVLLIAVFASGFLLVSLFRRLFHKRLSKPVYALLSVALSLVIAVSGFIVYLNIHYEAESAAVEVFSNGSAVHAEKTEFGYVFDGKGSETALVFYPGAKVDSEAYAPLMQKIAARGVDCFLLNVPFGMALFDMNAADAVLKKYDYRHWMISGHSMGGVAASSYVSSHHGAADALVLLASYPSQKIENTVDVLSIYGSNDKVLNMEAYNNSASNLPEKSEEFIIKGGNHAGFGNYGEQSGDGKADITNEAQQRRTAEKIAELAGKF
ncbi:MAG TPA: hypothetical protein DEO32_01070 [Ruminococcaceae bacterium]|nr:hypothetical protein [Oscillospiraceae bacterium]